MSVGRPVATLRLTCSSLEPDRISQILLYDEEGAARPGIHSLKIKNRNEVWLASTDELASPRANDHLRLLVSLFASRLSEIRFAFPDVEIDFSLLVFDPEFTLESLSLTLLTEATKIGSLEVEMPKQGKGASFTAHSFEEYAV